MKTLALSSVKFAVVGMVLAGGGGLTSFADAPRNLKWLYPSGSADFATAANWTWASLSDSGEITAGPGPDDTVRFYGLGTDGVVSFSSDLTVSNFLYEVTEAGRTLVDLAGHTLTVTNNMSLRCDRSVISTSNLTFTNGAIRVTGSAAGTKEYGQPKEDTGGFFINRSYASYAGVNLTFDNTTLVATNMVAAAACKFQQTSGTSAVRLLNGSDWTLPSFQIVNDTTCAIEFLAEDSALKLRSNLTIEGSGSCNVTFRKNASLQVGALRSAGRTAAGAVVLLDGGQHTLGRTENAGDNGSCSLTYTDLVISNEAALAAQSLMSVRSESSITVCDGATLTCADSLSIGHHANAKGFGDSALVVDNGTVSAKGLAFGNGSLHSNNCLRVSGPLARVEAAGAPADGAGAISVNNSGRIEFEIPADGYRDSGGTARVPVYANSVFRSNATDDKPVSLRLTTKAFDKKHPKESITLMQCGETTYKVNGTPYANQLELLTNNVVFVDSAKNPGTVSLSEDGKSLIYTAPAQRGMAVIVR